MRTLYIECNMGAAGDMLMAALSELLPEPSAFVDRMNALGLHGVRVEALPAEKCGVRGTHMRVTVHGEEEHSQDVHDHEHEHHHDHEHHDHEHHDHGHHHHHSGLHDVRGLIAGLNVPERVKRHAEAVYDLIASAESKVHGAPVDQVHFHEVGALDAVADVTGVCLLMDMLKPDRVVVSPIHVGCGEVRCAHGIVPVPAPATALILQGAPIYGGAIQGELCTPTGAALLRHFADEFGSMPTMTVERTGCGMGSKDFERANCVRAMLGETFEAASGPSDGQVAELRCNLDDMTGEALGFAMEALLDAGALDAWCQPIQMKKGRPGTMLCCLCGAGEIERFAQLMLRHTTTLGVRWTVMDRLTLRREAVELQSPWGPVRGKRSSGFGIERTKPEYDDLAAIAKREGLSLEAVRQAVSEAE